MKLLPALAIISRVECNEKKIAVLADNGLNNQPTGISQGL